MRLTAFVGLCLLAGMHSPQCLAADPVFEDFPAPAPSQRTLQTVIPPDVEHSPFLARAIGRKPDFAGRFVLAINGCGTACQQVAAIDVETGETHVPGEGVAANGACYRLDSRLLVLNPMAVEAEPVPKRGRTVFYEMGEAGFVQVGSTDQGTTLTCDP